MILATFIVSNTVINFFQFKITIKPWGHGAHFNAHAMEQMPWNRYTLNVPTPTVLPGRNVPVLYFCNGDDAFPLSTYMMKLYPQSNLTVKKQIFNYRMSRMRRISENCFGILANRWRIFRRPFMVEPEEVKTVTLTGITLHNWLREESENEKIYIPKGLIDHENIETGEIFECSWKADDV